MWAELKTKEEVCESTREDQYVLLQGNFDYQEAEYTCSLYGGTLASYNEQMKSAVKQVIYIIH